MALTYATFANQPHSSDTIRKFARGSMLALQELYSQGMVPADHIEDEHVIIDGDEVIFECEMMTMGENFNAYILCDDIQTIGLLVERLAATDIGVLAYRKKIVKILTRGENIDSVLDQLK